MPKDIELRIKNKPIRRVNQCIGEVAGLLEANRKIVAKVGERL